MKTAEYYVKVKIESEEDLPKAEGRYVAHLIEADIQGDYPYYGTKVSMKIWMKYIDWYLLPQQIELPSDGEIEKQADLKFDNWSNKAFWSGGAKWAVKWIKDKMK